MIEEDCATIKTTKGHQRVVEAFGLSPTRWWNKRQLNARNTWSTPDHLSCLWDDLELVTAQEGSTHPLFPVRIESLFLELLADNIKKESLDPEWAPGIAPLELSEADTHLETNMIVMKSERPVPRSWALLQNMSDIYHARKLAERDAVIYGVITDGSKWVFIHLTNQSRYTTKVFAWDNERDQIIGQFQNIIDPAVALYRKIMSRSSLPTPTVHQISRCQIRELPAPCAGQDNESGRVTEQNNCHTATIEEKAYNGDTDIGPLWW
ncbi:hypothetical protein N7519_002540 [Penicillium mononematosum]|uniref:uncharacterized protein n=1 Tax=Penicillium mononematosum TaxID=268346 RepID=UPI002547BF8C|nr:uncharacterized protein N7519_002540 [Penicillium mononematosum]KAJ6187632.1 hypothetical protein N7519_002540 [Penicillium mononematosum]